MKKVLSSLIILLLSFTALEAEDIVNTHHLQGTPYGLSVSSSFKVKLHCGQLSVTTTVSEEIADYVIVKIDGQGIVTIGLDYSKMPLKFRTGSHNWTLSADVSLPSLEVLDISGAVKLDAADSFEVKDLEAELSGASKVTGLSITGSEASFDISGASSAELTFRLAELEMDLSGTASADAEGKSGELSLDCSGSSDASINGEFSKVDAECSGACHINLKGTTSTLEADCSGASHISADDMTAEYVEVDASGASSIDVNVLKRIEIELSGASHIRYKAAPGVTEERKSIGKACSVTRK